jgi:hypothetical protein
MLIGICKKKQLGGQYAYKHINISTYVLISQNLTEILQANWGV